MEDITKGKGVNRFTYITIALFCGMFGCHRFYAGHWLAGICYLLTFMAGVSSVIFFGLGMIILTIELLVCLYDIVRALIAEPDANGLIVV